MARGIGEFGPIQDVIPEWAAVLVALVTQLGDVWFLALIVGALYWFRPDEREDVAVLIGVMLAGFAVLTGLKHVFALPRPEQPLVQLEALPALLRPLYEATGTADGYGFPSGHAFMTTVVYLGLARRLAIGTSRRRLLGAATVVAAVSLSRVALGVHYLVDVVAGVGAGLAFLLVAEFLIAQYAADRGTIAFSLAVVASAGGLLVAGDDPDAVLLVGASLGAFGGWQLVRLDGALSAADGEDRSSSGIDRSVAIRATLAAGAFVPLLAVFGYFGPVSLPAAGGALGLALAAAVSVPVLYLTRSERPIAA